MFMQCSFCNGNALYGCSVCGNVVCGRHVRMSPICVSHIKKSRCDYSIGESTEEEKEEIRQMVNSLWGEPEQLTFGRRYAIEYLPAFTEVSGTCCGLPFIRGVRN